MIKFTFLTRNLFAFTLIFTFYNVVFSQTFTNTSPVKWENYKVEAVKVSFLMPKLPVVVNESNYCRGEESFAYGSYAEGAAYVVRITRKFDVPEFCEEKKEFDETNFENRVSYFKNLKQRETVKSSSNEIILEGGGSILKLVNDYKNNRWFEFLVIGADETKTEVKNFLVSLNTTKKAVGIEIGDGADQTLGDERKQTVDDKIENAGKIDKKDDEKLGKPTPGRGNGIENSAVTPTTESSTNNSKAEPLRIVLKPRANYTDMARKNETQGKVVLRVVFSANGGIGSVSVVSGLADGLTEQAIAAARRILFVPARKNGVSYSVVKAVEYIFTIY